MGLNGAGKTSLLRILAGRSEPDRGDVAHRGRVCPPATTPRNTKASAPGVTVLDHLRDASDADRDETARALLGMFGLVGDIAFQDAGTLSGGEKTKLALAQLVAGRHNLLLLDEPTNNLDPPSREAIGRALADWPGTMILVSHDVGFVSELAPGPGAADARRHRGPLERRPARPGGAGVTAVRADRRRSSPRPRTALRRHRERADYDRDVVYAILDEGFICHAACVVDGTVWMIPTAYGRDGDRLLLHGAAANHVLKAAAGGAELTVTVTLLDGLVLARSTFHHSHQLPLRGDLRPGHRDRRPDEKAAPWPRSSTTCCPAGRGRPITRTRRSWPSTRVVSLPLDEVSAKVRTGGPIDDEEDLGLPVWAGVLPLRPAAGPPSPTDGHPAGVDPPAYLTQPAAGAPRSGVAVAHPWAPTSGRASGRSTPCSAAGPGSPPAI